MHDSLGERIGRLRTALGLTQQELADRIAVSRVAISHLEMGLQVPSERTIALLAGVFKVDPHALVADTYYPAAKAERLPSVVAHYTELEHQLALLDRDLQWIERIRSVPQTRHLIHPTLHGWLDRLATLHDATADRRSCQQLDAARERVQRMLREA